MILANSDGIKKHKIQMTKFPSKPTKEWYQYIFSKQHTQTIDNLIHIFIYFIFHSS